MTHEKTPRLFSIEEFKLACIDRVNFTDAEVKRLALRVVIKSESDVEYFTAILKEYRPEIERTFICKRG